MRVAYDAANGKRERTRDPRNRSVPSVSKSIKTANRASRTVYRTWRRVCGFQGLLFSGRRRKMHTCAWISRLRNARSLHVAPAGKSADSPTRGELSRRLSVRYIPYGILEFRFAFRSDSALRPGGKGRFPRPPPGTALGTSNVLFSKIADCDTAALRVQTLNT
jgi:hypothetical protein